jgi:hypothetical protein
MIEKKYPVHPFSNGVTKDNAKKLMASYLAMSEAFPYIQAASASTIIKNAIVMNKPIDSRMAKMFSVGAFLSFDETGGNYLLRTKGMKSLHEILEVEENFHSKLLEKDMRRLFKEVVLPDYSSPTKQYLFSLQKSLSSTDLVVRSASMVAFELHAGAMIDALWKTLSNLYEIDRSKLTYFNIHVGGNDPGEKYHQETTQEMIRQVVSTSKSMQFFNCFLKEYGKHINWCENIKKGSSK